AIIAKIRPLQRWDIPSAAASVATATGLIEDDAPLDSAEKGGRRPEADVLPAAPEPVDTIRTGLQVLERDAWRARASPGHQRVQCTGRLGWNRPRLLVSPSFIPSAGKSLSASRTASR